MLATGSCLFCINIDIKVSFNTLSWGRVQGPGGTPRVPDVDKAVLCKEFVMHTQGNVIYNVK